MSLFTKFQSAIKSEDAKQYGALYHEDFQFIRHQTGGSMSKTEVVSMIEKMFASGAVKQDNHRCIYENDTILVEHSFMTFPDGSKEAVLAVHTLEDGRIIRTETGATLLK